MGKRNNSGVNASEFFSGKRHLLIYCNELKRKKKRK